MRALSRMISKPRTLLVLLLSLLALKAGLNLVHAVLVEAMNRDYGHSDNALYLGVGRSLLNGLSPYRDVFEDKPPGIFFVAAFSLWASGGVVLASLLQAAVIGSIPFILIGAVRRRLRAQDRAMRVTLLLTFLFGVLLALFASAGAGQFQTESFGAMFGVLYAHVLFVQAKSKRRWRLIASASVCVLGAIAFKESFVLSLGAVALIFSDSLESFLEQFGIPLVVAMTMGAILLQIFGYFSPYLTTYLSYLLNEHGVYLRNIGVQTPLWMRGFFFRDSLASLPHLNPFFASLIGALLLVVPLLPLLEYDPSLPRRKSLLPRLCRFLAVCYLTVLSVELAGATMHQQVVALPVYAALFLTLIPYLHRLFAEAHRTRFSLVRPMIVLLIAVAVLYTPLVMPWQGLGNFSESNDHARSIAAEIDGVLDRCQFDRYVSLSIFGDQFYAYTRHSPLPIGPMQTALSQKMEVSTFRQMIVESLVDAPLIVLKNGDMLHPSLVDYIQTRFERRSPRCAGSVHLPSTIVLLFRKNAGNTKILR
ncbi:hypothetical protein HY213_02150 [Candidatus Peregrinibacteria bacterium]|nr:hypothetical protein [Candidatus Peregrinibacteria bacterium]